MHIKETIMSFIWLVLFIIIAILLFRTCTSPEIWYVGEHDGQCEVMLSGGDYERDECGCYERLLEADRKRREDLNKKKK